MKKLVILAVLLFAFVAFAAPVDNDVGAGDIVAFEVLGDSVFIQSIIAFELYAFEVGAGCFALGYSKNCWSYSTPTSAFGTRVVPPDIPQSGKSAQYSLSNLKLTKRTKSVQL